MNSSDLRLASFLIGFALLAGTCAGFAQETDVPSLEPSDAVLSLDIARQLRGGLLGGLADESEMISFSGRLQVRSGTRDGKLSIEAELAPLWHTYALDQVGGPGPSKLTVFSSNDFEVLGEFQPEGEPVERIVALDDGTPIWKEPVREHHGKVIWTVPIRLAEGVNPEKLKAVVRFDGQVCQDAQDGGGGCILIRGREIEVAFGGYFTQNEPVGEYRAARTHVTLYGHAQPKVARPGGKVRLILTAVPDPSWHVYAYADKDPRTISKPTLIVLTETIGWQTAPPVASAVPIGKPTGLPEEPVSFYHEKPVSWTIELDVPPDAQLQEYELKGLIGYQTCTTNGCDMPTGAEFTVRVPLAREAMDGKLSMEFRESSYAKVAKLVAVTTDVPRGAPPLVTSDEGMVTSGFDKTKLALQDEAKSQPWYTAILIALAGGFILNFMPCVLPVIGLKIMSFVEQAGQSRARAFALNIWYTVGLVSVFLVLATLAAVWNLGWGQQNQSGAFNVTMAAVVFVMGLSFLGVWEIPIPGFVGGGSASKMAEQEGVAGAFAKGVITTILAVPCSGPLVATALAWSHNKSPALVYLVFTCMGLGMSFPYIVIGANPNLIRFLPRPGPWMETFKQVMGFVLMATVIWILSFIPWSQMLPTLAFLFGLWAACWWVGRTPLTAEFSVKLRAWAGAAVLATLFGIVSLLWLNDVMQGRFARTMEREIAARLAAVDEPTNTATPHTVLGNDQPPSGEHHLAWEPFSIKKLEQITAQGKTVMVDFTADWCPTCKVLEATTLNTKSVKQAVERNGVVPLLADWTEPNAEISELLELLGSKQIPVLAIFPAHRANEPIVLRGWYSIETLLRKLEEAGPSAGLATTASHASISAAVVKEH